MIRPAAQPIRHGLHLPPGPVREQAELALALGLGRAATAAEHPDLVVAVHRQPALLAELRVEQREAAAAVRPAVDQIAGHDDEVRPPGLDVFDNRLQRGQHALHVGEDRDLHADCSRW